MRRLSRWTFFWRWIFGFASPAQLRAGLAGILNHLEGFCLTGAMRFGPPRRPRHVMMRRPERGLCWSAFDVSSQLGADPAVAQSASGRPVAPATLMRRPEGGFVLVRLRRKSLAGG